MVMVQQLQLQPQQQQKQPNGSVDGSNQNGASLKRAAGGGGRDGMWPSQDNILKVKRPMLGGRRIIGGPSTPVPRWKLYENPFYDGIAAAAAAAAQQQQHRRAQVGGGAGGGGSVAVSARKLAATLWELQEFPFSLAAAAHAASSKASSCPCIQHRTSSSSSSSSTAAATALAARKARSPLQPFSEKKVIATHKVNGNSTSPPSPSPFQTDVAPPAPQPTSVLQSPQQPAANVKESMISLQHPNKAWDSMKKVSQSNSTSSRQVAAMRSHVHRLLERRADARLTRLASVQANSSGSYMVLNRIQDIQEQRSTAMPSSVVTALRIELECTRARAHELELAHKSSRREIENLLKKVTEEKLLWRNKEEEKIRNAVQAIKSEAEDEKKARRRVESVNRKMSRELIDANIAVAKAVQELERERKARELMEDVCDELAREIGEDKAEVEELKRESARVREEVEEERQMLQMAEVWREERVQMKLGEARLEIEEKVAALDNLRIQLEAFLESRKSPLHDTETDEVSSRGGASQEAENLANALNSLKLRDVLQDPCGSPAPGGELPDPYRADGSSSAISHSDGRRSWGWGGVQSPELYAGSNHHRLETREEVLERLRRKYDQNVPRNSILSRSQEAAAAGTVHTRRIEDERREGSDCYSPSEHQQDDDTKEEEGSQWESASEEDALEALQQQSSNSNGSTTRSDDHRLGAEEDTVRPPQPDGATPACSSSRSDSTSSAPVYHPSSRASPSEAPPADELWKVESPPRGEQDANEEQPPQQQRRLLSGESTKFLLGRGMADPSRNPFIKSSAPDQGTATASPSRDWRSPDRGNPHIARGIKGFIEWPKMSRENGLKNNSNRVLEGSSRVDKVERRMLKQAS